MRQRYMHFLRGFVLIASCALLLLAGACSKETGGEKSGKEKEAAGQKDPNIIGRKIDVVLKRLDGKDVKFDEYLGRIVVVNFFAPWQRNKFDELVPIMTELGAKMSRRADVIYVSLGDGSAEPVKRFLEGREIKQDVYINGKEIAGAFGGVGTLPSTFIVYDDGTLYERIEGLHSRRFYWGRIFLVLRKR